MLAVTAEHADSAVANHPAASVQLPQGFVLTAGGAEVHWQGKGNLLWALQPEFLPHGDAQSPQGFTARSKDHIDPDPASLTVWAVGIRAF